VDKRTKGIIYAVSLGILFFILSLVIAVLVYSEPQPECASCPPCNNSNPMQCKVCSMACSFPSTLDMLIRTLLLVYGAYIVIAALSYAASLKLSKNKPKLLLFAKSIFIGALIGFCLILLAPSFLGYMSKLIALVIKPSLAQELKTLLS
jgi:hypothetical protein